MNKFSIFSKDHIFSWEWPSDSLYNVLEDKEAQLTKKTLCIVCVNSRSLPCSLKSVQCLHAWCESDALSWCDVIFCVFMFLCTVLYSRYCFVLIGFVQAVLTQARNNRHLVKNTTPCPNKHVSLSVSSGCYWDNHNNFLYLKKKHRLVHICEVYKEIIDDL